MPKIINDDQVYRAAMTLFVNRGYERTTTKGIADAAGVHEATLFRKYGSKANLITEAIQHRLSTVPLARLDHTDDLSADLLAIVRAYVETFEMEGAITAMLLVQLPQYPELRHAMATPMVNIQRMVGIIEHHQAAGRLKPEAPLTTVNDLLGPLMLRYMLRRVLEYLPISPFDPEPYVDAFLNGRGA